MLDDDVPLVLLETVVEDVAVMLELLETVVVDVVVLLASDSSVEFSSLAELLAGTFSTCGWRICIIHIYIYTYI